MDCPNFIFEVVNEFVFEPNYNGYIWARDRLNIKIENYINNNDIKTNQQIVKKFGGGDDKAFNLYKYHNGNTDNMQTMLVCEFYKQLAKLLLLLKVYSPLMNLIIGILNKLWSYDINIIQRNLNLFFFQKMLNGNANVYIKDSFKIYEDLKIYYEELT